METREGMEGDGVESRNCATKTPTHTRDGIKENSLGEDT